MLEAALSERSSGTEEPDAEGQPPEAAQR
jgi:hypothetical protein